MSVDEVAESGERGVSVDEVVESGVRGVSVDEAAESSERDVSVDEVAESSERDVSVDEVAESGVRGVSVDEMAESGERCVTVHQVAESVDPTLLLHVYPNIIHQMYNSFPNVQTCDIIFDACTHIVFQHRSRAGLRCLPKGGVTDAGSAALVHCLLHHDHPLRSRQSGKSQLKKVEAV